MKKNLMSVLILALVIVDLVLTAIMMISIVPQTRKSNELIDKVCSAINLELQSGEVTDVATFPIEQRAVYNLENEFTINLKNSVDQSGKSSAHYAILDVSIYMDKENEDYAKYGKEDKISEYVKLIENEVITTVKEYTKEELTENTESVQKEITKRLQTLFDSEFIIGVGFSKLTCS